ncbi:MAG: hemolysin family protein [Planctomycetota bacterium]
MTAVVAIAALVLLISFACSLFEAALYAITPTQLEVLRQRGTKGAGRIARLRANVEEPIAAILTINTVSNTLGPLVCGAMVSKLAGGDQLVGVLAAILTLAVLIGGEIVPKSLGVRYAPSIAPWIAFPLQIMIWVSWPVARSARGLMHLLSSGSSERGATAEEILVLTRLASRSGALRPHELRWVENALRLDDVTAQHIMTPRTVVESLAAELTVRDLQAEKLQWVHTRLPLVENGNPDAIVGIVHGKDVFRAILAGDRERPIRELAQPVDIVPETMTGGDLLNKFIKERKHLMVVVDEYGGFEGIVTLEDVLECMLGSEILDEHDEHADMQLVARRQALERARALSAEAPASPPGTAAGGRAPG